MARIKPTASHPLGAGLSLWAETKPVRPQLTRSRIVQTALQVLNDEGFDGLTMRNLASRLGIKAASLYNHVRDKDELLAMIADTICAEILEPDSQKSWRDQLRAMALQIRRVLMEHRDGARVLAATPPIGPNRIRLIELVLRILTEAGFRRTAVVDASFVMNSYVVGFVLDETIGSPRDAVAAERSREQAKQWFKSLPSEQYPTLTALSDELIDAPADRRFESGLRALLDGFELRLGKRRQ